MVNVISGFRTTGIFPFNSKKLLPKSPPQSSICQRIGLDFIPLFSPAPGRPLRESPETPTQSSGEHEDVSFESLPELSYSDDESCESCEPVPNRDLHK